MEGLRGAAARHALMLTCAVAAAALATPQPACAQTLPEGVSLPSTTAFQRGLALLRAQRWVEAVPELEEAVRQEATPIRWYNLALAYRGAAQAAAACDAFYRYLASPEAGASEARLAAVREEVASLLQSVATVRLTVDPEGAALRVDRRASPTVAGELLLDPGMHVLELEAPSCEPLRRELSVRAGEIHSLELRLRPTPPPQLPPPPHAAIAASPATALARDVFAAPEMPGRRRRWVLPVAVAGSVVVIAGVVVAVLLATRPVDDPTMGSWTTVRDP